MVRLRTRERASDNDFQTASVLCTSLPPIYPSIRPSIHPSTSIHPSIQPFIHPFMHPYTLVFSILYWWSNSYFIITKNHLGLCDRIDLHKNEQSEQMNERTTTTTKRHQYAFATQLHFAMKFCSSFS